MGVAPVLKIVGEHRADQVAPVHKIVDEHRADQVKW